MFYAPTFSAYLFDLFSFGIFSMACSCCFFVIAALANLTAVLPAFAFAFGFGGGGGGCVGFGGLATTDLDLDRDGALLELTTD